MTDEQKEQRKKAIERSAGYCAVNRKKYGSFFIDSTFNGEMVCSLECNAKVDVGKSRGRILDKLADILIKEIKAL